MLRTGLFEPFPDPDAMIDGEPVISALAAAYLAAPAMAETAWRDVGITCANHLIDHRPDLAVTELAEADWEWNTNSPRGSHYLAIVSGYRDTLREHIERGSDV